MKSVIIFAKAYIFNSHSAGCSVFTSPGAKQSETEPIFHKWKGVAPKKCNCITTTVHHQCSASPVQLRSGGNTHTVTGIHTADRSKLDRRRF